MKRKIAKPEVESSAKSYYSQAYPEGYGKDFTKTIAGGKSDDGKKFKFTPIEKEFKLKDQNKQDAQENIKNISKSWQDQEHGVYHSVVEAANKIIMERFAKFEKALETSAQAMYKNLESNPLRSALYTNFREAGFDADTAHYIVENAFDETAQETHEALLNGAKEMFSLEIADFSKKISEITNKDRMEDESLCVDCEEGSGPYKETSKQPASYVPGKGYRTTETEDKNMYSEGNADYQTGTTAPSEDSQALKA